MRRPALPSLAWLALPLAVVAAYWPALEGGFLWDDDAHVTRSDLRSLHGLWRIWFEPGATQQYYPVLHSAFWAEHRLWGDSVLGYHLANVLLHAGACLLLYHVLRRLAVPGALLAAAAFALHPVCVESVAWISEQKNTLSGVFYMAAALTYLRFDAGRRPGAYAAATALFALALLSKTVTATLPGALLVVLWWRNGRLGARRDVLPLVPWLAMGAAAGLVTSWMERAYVGAAGPAFALGLVDRFLIAGRAAWFYLGKILWPAHLVFTYPRWTVDPHALWQYSFPVAAAGALLMLLALPRHPRGPFAAALIFVGTLFPALGFIDVYPFVFSFVADHFQYLAAACMISALSAGVALAAGRLGPAGVMGTRAAAVALLAVLAALTWARCGSYADAETFYRTLLAGNPASWMAHDNLGVVLVRKGLRDEAVSHYREAIRLNPSYPEAFNNYGNVLAQERRWPEAAEAYAGALRARPSFAEADYNWGNALSDAGRYGEAELHFRKALALRRDYADAHYGLATALANEGRLAEAAPEFQETLRLRPGSAEAHANLGLALAEEGNLPAALSEIGEAIRLRPGYAEAHAYDGVALADAGRLAEAVEQFREALRINPANPDVHYQLGLALRRLGQAQEADAQFRAAGEGTGK
jgi:tetratricopeptide (TPR) repeat protein